MHTNIKNVLSRFYAYLDTEIYLCIHIHIYLYNKYNKNISLRVGENERALREGNWEELDRGKRGK